MSAPADPAEVEVFETAEISVIELNAEGRALYGEQRHRKIRRAAGFSDAEIDGEDWRFHIRISMSADGRTREVETTAHSGATAEDIVAVLRWEAQRWREGW